MKHCVVPPNSEVLLQVHVSRRDEEDHVLLEPNNSLYKKV